MIHAFIPNCLWTNSKYLNKTDKQTESPESRIDSPRHSKKERWSELTHAIGDDISEVIEFADSVRGKSDIDDLFFIAILKANTDRVLDLLIANRLHL